MFFQLGSLETTKTPKEDSLRKMKEDALHKVLANGYTSADDKSLPGRLNRRKSGGNTRAFTHTQTHTHAYTHTDTHTHTETHAHMHTHTHRHTHTDTHTHTLMTRGYREGYPPQVLR
jgi:hypothetical protein